MTLRANKRKRLKRLKMLDMLKTLSRPLKLFRHLAHLQLFGNYAS